MECGTARIEITPPVKTVLFGYPGEARIYEPHKDRILDPLQARVLYLEEGAGPGVLLLSLDLCILLDEDAGFLRRVLAEKFQIPRENILVACTHTHSAPLPRFSPRDDPNGGLERFRQPDREEAFAYGKWLLPRLVKTVKLALSRKCTVDLYFRETLSGLGYDRRCLTPEGIRNCWNPDEFPDRVPRPARGVRHAVLKLVFRDRPGGVVMSSTGIHPVVMGKESNRISSDWPGQARRHVEKRMRRFQALFVQGAAAQVQPWLSTQGDPRALRWVGEAIGAESLLLGLGGRRIETDGRAFGLRERPVPDTGIAVTTFALGDLLVIGLPLELSTSVADEIAAAVGRPVFFICLCNGWNGYWMSRREFEEGGYEIEIARGKGLDSSCSENLMKLFAANTHAS